MTPSAEAYREAIGERLKAFREGLGLTAYRVAQRGGIRIDQVKSVEQGTTNYTIDIFIGYIRGCGLYMFFGEKGVEHQPPLDIDDMFDSMTRNDPE